MLSNAHLTFVLGGARSGKSRYAESLVTQLPTPWIYVATAQALDEEMRERIERHRAQRVAGWITMEAPLDIAVALDAAGAAPVLVDCLTLWLTNVMLRDPQAKDLTVTLMEALRRRTAPTVLVSNETGLGIVPDNALARRFRDESGLLHQLIGALANRVVLMVAGLPLSVKP